MLRSVLPEPAVRCRGCGGWVPREGGTRYCGHCGRPVDLPLGPGSGYKATLGLQGPRAGAEALPPLEPAPIPLTKRKRSLVAVGAMLGNEVGHSSERASPVGPAPLGGEPAWVQAIDPVSPAVTGSCHTAERRDAELAYAATWRAESIEALPPPGSAEVASGRPGAALPAIVPPRSVPDEAQGAEFDQQPEVPRFPGRIDLSLHSSHNFYAGFDSTIDSGGLFVATCAPFELGESLLVSFSLSGLAGSWSSRGIVEWTVPVELERRGCLPGMGLRLLDLDSRIEAVVNRFMRQREPIFYEPR